MRIGLRIQADETQVGVGAEEVAFTADDGGLRKKVGRDILLQAVDDHVVTHDRVVDVLPVIFGVIVGGGEGIVGTVDGTVVVTEVGHGVEAVAHHLGSDIVHAVLRTAEVGEHTVLETIEVAGSLHNLLGIVGDRVVRHQVQVAGSKQGDGRAERKGIDDLFHIRSVLSVRT